MKLIVEHDCQAACNFSICQVSINMMELTLPIFSSKVNTKVESKLALKVSCNGYGRRYQFVNQATIVYFFL